MTTELTGKQLEYISDSMLAGISTVDQLRQYVRISLDKDLDEIALGKDLTEITFNAVDWADRNGCVGKLVECFYSETGDNETIQKLYAFWHDLQSSPKPSSPSTAAAGALASTAAVPPAPPQVGGRRRARVIIEGDDTTVILGGPGPKHPPAAPAAAPAPGLRTAAPARSKLYLRVIAALLLAALVLLAFMLGRTFTNPPPAPVPAAVAPAPEGISLAPGSFSPLSAPHL
jgi:hypothetical protein